MLPVRCFTCNKILGNLERSFHAWKGEVHYDAQDPEASLLPFFEAHRISRYCCRRILLTCHDDTVVSAAQPSSLPSTITVQETVTFPRLYLAR